MKCSKCGKNFEDTYESNKCDICGGDLVHGFSDSADKPSKGASYSEQNSSMYPVPDTKPNSSRTIKKR